ncbi:MAG: hypothetical protein IJ067_00020 [Prevotella sp.]|nr:hypothetical protein [Prevotella sp.]
MTTTVWMTTASLRSATHLICSLAARAAFNPKYIIHTDGKDAYLEFLIDNLPF